MQSSFVLAEGLEIGDNVPVRLILDN